MRKPQKAKPLSRAYLSLCPMHKSDNKLAAEEQKLSDVYHRDFANRMKKTRNQYLRDEIRNHLIESGYPSQKVDETFKRVKEIPKGLEDAFFALMEEYMKKIGDADQDLRHAKETGSL
mmetsp:Transcript_29498/g.28650  ORF Transcript_29498/g.28650 Transcript_29498/m.28650 type:complete len:118 (-) Transcript_29498:82-435(-)